jgi:manganese transport protein
LGRRFYISCTPFDIPLCGLHLGQVERAKEEMVAAPPRESESASTELAVQAAENVAANEEAGVMSEAIAASSGTEMVALDVSTANDNVDNPNDDTDREPLLLGGWRQANDRPSLSEVHSTVRWPQKESPWYKKVFAMLGVGFMISVGYMDPGNWATDLEGGSNYGYTLLSVILLSNICAVLLQTLALRLGVVAERDLAQACRDAYPKYVVYVLWIITEIAIAATDMAEVIGSATALYLLFGLPIWAGVLVTAVDTLFILVMGLKSFRFLEFLVALLAFLIAGIFAYELAVVKPVWVDVAKGLIPKAKIITNHDILYTGIGILGATVMPHSLYLHSSIIQTRAYPRTKDGKKAVIKYAQWDSSVSLMLAFFVNASILILSAAAFHYGANKQELSSITDAYKLLAPALGSNSAKILFAVGLLASGQNSTIIGTLAGQIVMEGFLQIKLKPWIRRSITRGIAIIPAAIVAGIGGNRGAGKLLVLSQVILSLALSFSVIPLVQFTSSTAKMGPQFVNGLLIKAGAVIVALIIACLNIYLLYSSIQTNSFGSAGSA